MTEQPTIPPLFDHGAQLLNILLWHPKAYNDVKWLPDEAFLNPHHQRLFRAICHTIDRLGVDSDVIIPETRALLVKFKAPPHLISVFVDLCTTEAVSSVTSAAYHAEALWRDAQRQRLRQALMRSEQMFRETEELGDLTRALRDEWDTALGVAERGTGFETVPDLYTVQEFSGLSVHPHDWVIPGLLERQERLIIVAPEKAGKSVLSRQVALSLALGRHPLWQQQDIEPKRTLIVDLENPSGIIRRDLDRQQRNMGRLVEDNDNAWIWHQPAGIHLGDRNDVLMLERAIDISGADLVLICPLYKAYDNLSESWEQQAFGVQKPLDLLRARYKCAFWLEHHAPKGNARSLLGSSRWARWFDLKVALVPEDPDLPPPYTKLMWEATYREENRIAPVSIERASTVSWLAAFPAPFQRVLEEAQAR